VTPDHAKRLEQEARESPLHARKRRGFGSILDARSEDVVVGHPGQNFPFGRADAFESRQGRAGRVGSGDDTICVPGPADRSAVRPAAHLKRELARTADAGAL